MWRLLKLGKHITLWRGSLLPLGCEAAPYPNCELFQTDCIRRMTTAAQPNGSKLPRHKGSVHSG
ncbi:hypothetical protein FQ192_17025 [Pseudomonas sp. ANT_J12]|nr:hypothetical protein FQ192_17025 [Pseudomonas sp. ANT_J12]